MAYITTTKKRIEEIATYTRHELYSRGYSADFDDIRLQVECVIHALHVMTNGEDIDAYAPVHETAYYRDNGCAYLAAQDIIFSTDDIKRMQAKALESRRADMMEAGTWTDAHEREFMRKTA